MPRVIRGTILLALLLIAGGVAGLVLPQFAYTTKEHVVDVGPIEIKAEERTRVNIPQVAALAALVAGIVLLYASQRAPGA